MSVAGFRSRRGHKRVAQSREAAQRAEGTARHSKTSSIRIELTQSQIRSVFVEGGDSDGGDYLFRRLGGDVATLRALIDSTESEAQPKLSQSLIRGLYLLAILAERDEPLGVLELSKRVGCSPSTVHRYLQTLLLTGLAQRDETTREYSPTF
jgi:hypothetical protein